MNRNRQTRFVGDFGRSVNEPAEARRQRFSALCAVSGDNLRDRPPSHANRPAARAAVRSPPWSVARSSGIAPGTPCRGVPIETIRSRGVMQDCLSRAAERWRASGRLRRRANHRHRVTRELRHTVIAVGLRDAREPAGRWAEWGWRTGRAVESVSYPPIFSRWLGDSRNFLGVGSVFVRGLISTHGSSSGREYGPPVVWAA